MTKDICNYNDYESGMSYIEEYEHSGWCGKITINEPCVFKNVWPNEPIVFYFSFSGKVKGRSLDLSKPLKPSHWHVYAEVPFKAGLEKVTICKKAILDECEQEYYRTIPLDDNLQKKHIIDALEEAIDVFEKFFTEKGKGFVPDEDFYRDVFYVDVPGIENLEDEVTIDNLQIKKKCLINLIDQELLEAEKYKTVGCDAFWDGQLQSSYWSKEEAGHELMLLKKADYFRNEDYYHKYFDTLEEAEAFRKLTFVNSLLGEGPEAITSTDNIIRVAKFREDRIKKYRKNIEKYLETCG